MLKDCTVYGMIVTASCVRAMRIGSFLAGPAFPMRRRVDFEHCSTDCSVKTVSLIINAALVVALALVALSVLVIGLFPSEPFIVIPVMVIWSIAFGAAPPMLQTRMLHTASPRIRDVASFTRLLRG